LIILKRFEDITFDADMIKKLQKRYPKRVFAARQNTGKPLALSKKSFILTFGSEYYLTFFKRCRLC